jgi:hypothetical protein
MRLMLSEIKRNEMTTYPYTSGPERLACSERGFYDVNLLNVRGMRMAAGQQVVPPTCAR